VRPSDFEWAWFNELLDCRLQKPEDFELVTNLRSPRRIATVVNRCEDLYHALPKWKRPRRTAQVEIEDESSDDLVYCVVQNVDEGVKLLRKLTEINSWAIVCLGETVPDDVPSDIRDRVITVEEAKGLHFSTVCLLNPGALFQRMCDDLASIADLNLESLTRRVDIDRFRVAVSRATERLFFVE